jgi:glycerophosphoryl diester phosphodiesterase
MWILLIVVLTLILLWILALTPRVRNQPDLTPLKNRFYAHRGYYLKDQSIPENSLPAFFRAVQNSFGVELDVHLTKDGRLAVLHDENLKRMCGADVNLSELTVDQLKNYHLMGTKEHIPLFTDVLKVIDGKVPMVIEVKPYGGNIGTLCERLCLELEGYTGVTCVESFDPRAVYWFKKHRPALVRGQLAMYWRQYGKEVGPIAAFAVSNLLTSFLTRPDFIAYRFEDRKNLSFRLSKALYGVQEFSWTIHTPADAAEVQKTGGLIIFEFFDPRA